MLKLASATIDAEDEVIEDLNEDTLNQLIVKGNHGPQISRKQSQSRPRTDVNEKESLGSSGETLPDFHKLRFSMSKYLNNNEIPNSVTRRSSRARLSLLTLNNEDYEMNIDGNHISKRQDNLDQNKTQKVKISLDGIVESGGNNDELIEGDEGSDNEDNKTGDKIEKVQSTYSESRRDEDEDKIERNPSTSIQIKTDTDNSPGNEAEGELNLKKQSQEEDVDVVTCPVRERTATLIANFEELEKKLRGTSS